MLTLDYSNSLLKNADREGFLHLCPFLRTYPTRASRRSALLLYDLHLFFVHTTAMHPELG